MAVVKIEKTGTGWKLPLEGADVCQILVDHAVTIRFLLGTLSASIRIEGSFDLRDGDQSYSLAPERRALLGPVIELLGARVGLATAREDGHLQIKFTDGRCISVHADQSFEAWEFEDSSTDRIVCGPRGELTVWSA